jgi:hypothetical protein
MGSTNPKPEKSQNPIFNTPETMVWYGISTYLGLFRRCLIMGGMGSSM